MNLIGLLKDGQQYMQLCPQDARFKATFPEINIIQLTRLGIRFAPPLAVLLFIWQYYMDASLVVSIVTILFALSLPVQGMLWLGKRARMPLPLTLLAWFNELKQQLIKNRILGEKAALPPTYMELMKLVRLCQKQLHQSTDYSQQQEVKTIPTQKTTGKKCKDKKRQ